MSQESEPKTSIKKEPSIFARLAVVVGDFFLLGLSFVVIFISDFKYMCFGAGIPPLWVSYIQYLFIITVIGFILFIPFTATKGNDGKKTMFWVRIIYLVIWIMYLISVAYTPALTGGSC